MTLAKLLNFCRPWFAYLKLGLIIGLTTSQMLQVFYIYNTEHALSTNDYVPSSSQCYKDFENDDCCLHFPKVTDNRQKHRVQQTQVHLPMSHTGSHTKLFSESTLKERK